MKLIVADIGFRQMFYLCIMMKKPAILLILFFTFLFYQLETANAQCSICAKTTQQLGDKPARGFNSGIIYLMLAPFGIIGVVGYKWWKTNKDLY